MDETNRNSMKLDIEAVRLSENDRESPKESYKQVSEFDLNEKLTVKCSNMVRENGDNQEDGADEKMLEGDEKSQLARKDEVKFISGEHPNGDAKIDIGNIEKAFTGMTKDELMKFANDPFWVRLRWIFFILFWALWVAMLAGAILIIIRAPKCSAPVALSWFKEGPLVQLPPSTVEPQVISKLKEIKAKGVIFQLPADKTYLVDTPEVQDYVKDLVSAFKNTTINVILDLTPNFVTTEDELYRSALNDTKYRGAFVWVEGATVPTNWVSKADLSSAWKEVKAQNWVLSQFGINNIDLRLNDPIAKEKFKKVLQSLIALGVKGFRLSNVKHFIVASKDLKDDLPSDTKGIVHNDYKFWIHDQTTFQPGLGDLLEEFATVVQNYTKGEGFLSVTEDVERTDVFFGTNGHFAFDIPIHSSVLTRSLTTSAQSLANRLYSELSTAVKEISIKTWTQWVYNETANPWTIGLSEYNIFLFLLPGVPVGSVENFIGNGDSDLKNVQLLEEIRSGASYQHGSFDVYLDAKKAVVAYTRIKSGNPGYFVAFNPDNAEVTANFSAIASLPEQLTVFHVSEKYNITGVTEKSKVHANNIVLAPRSAIILTYVPKKDD